MSILAIMRSKKGYTTEQMALFLGLSVERYIELEAHPDYMSPDQAKHACRVLSCDIDTLFPVVVS